MPLAPPRLNRRSRHPSWTRRIVDLRNLAQAVANPFRSGENPGYGNNSRQLVSPNGGQTSRCHAAAFATYRVAAELAWRNARGEVSRNAVRSLGKDALLRRGRRLRVAVKYRVRQLHFWKRIAQAAKFAHCPLPVLRRQSLLAFFSLLRRIQAEPDFANLLALRPESRKLAEVAPTLPKLLPRDRAMNYHLMTGDMFQDAVIGCR
jgi:hypothetical protein